MHATSPDRSPVVRAVLVAVAAGVLLRLGIFANNVYYPDVGMPTVLAVPALGALVVGALTYVLGRNA